MLWLTDLHLADELLYGRDPMAQLDALMRHFRQVYADVDLLVLSGNLCDSGRFEHYLALKNALDAAGIPYLPLVGNHDDRASFFDVFPDSRDAAGFAQRAMDVGDWRIIGIDTVSPNGARPPTFCSRRDAWLRHSLEKAASEGRRCVVFMHHALQETQISESLDSTILESAELVATLKAHRDRIELIAFGHLHRPIAGSWNGISICCNWATSHQTIHQARMDQLCSEVVTSPRYGYIRLLDSGPQVHLRSMDWETAFSVAKEEAAAKEA